MSNQRSQKSVDVRIVSFNKKGYGVGTTNDAAPQKVQVPFSMPGDRIQGTVQRKRSGVITSRLESLIEASPQRIAPRCIHFGTCGGCRWQHVPYPEQLRIKQESVEALFRPLLVPDFPIKQIIPCDPPWQYRNKMEFSFSNDAAGNHYLGLIIDSSRGKVLNLTECHLVNTWFAEALTAVRKWWEQSGLKAYHPYSNSGSLRTLTLREGLRTGDRLAMLTVSGNADFALNKQQLDGFNATVREIASPSDPSSHLSIFLRIQQIAKGTPTNFYEMLLHGPDHIREILHVSHAVDQQPVDLKFTVGPSSFFQPNTRQAEKLYSSALQLLDLHAGSIVYDLYCGTGTLGICTANRAKQVLGIEISAEAALDARTNVANNHLDNVKIITGAVHDVIAQVRKGDNFERPDAVMVDPPRSGLDADTIRHLIELAPKKILYISCNPASQAENVKELQAAGYVVQAIQPVDQFPHTVHIENIVVMRAATSSAYT